MKVLITGAAGFIGSHLSRALALEGHQIIGIDSINDYYDPFLKYERLRYIGGFDTKKIHDNGSAQSDEFGNYRFIRLNICNKEALKELFITNRFDTVVHFAAQAGVRYSIENPQAYIDSNISGYLNILEGCRNYGVRKLLYASSSSVYGDLAEAPFSEDTRTDEPLSLYAATKKSNELMAYSYSHLFRFQVTGVRLFTVYGPWGRPDMAPFIFTNSVFEAKRIKLFNHGNMFRDFTYIDDTIEAIVKLLHIEHPNRFSANPYYSIFNIGNRSPVALCDFVKCIERSTGLTALIENHPMQPGDVLVTCADNEKLYQVTGFVPSTPIERGIEEYVKWFRNFYKITGERAIGINWSENEKN